jgi:hypothetical protein
VRGRDINSGGRFLSKIGEDSRSVRENVERIDRLVQDALRGYVRRGLKMSYEWDRGCAGQMYADRPFPDGMFSIVVYIRV